MSTHAIIAISDGINIRASYVNYDGYPSHTGVILNAHYNSPDKINSLIDLGELSAIGTDTDHCQAYGRDRGESGTEPRKFASLSDLNEYGSRNSKHGILTIDSKRVGIFNYCDILNKFR